MELKEALLALDSLEDAHWTSNGDAKIDVLKEMTGDKSLTRQDIVNIAPQFNRSNMVVGVPDLEVKTDAEEVRKEEEVTPADDVIEEYLAGEPLMPEQFAQVLRRCSDDDLKDLEKVLDEQMAQAELARQTAENLYKMIRLSASMTRVAIKQRIPDVDNQTAIREYIEAQNKARAAKFDQALEIKKLIGRDLTKLDPRSPIDRAMARKTARGGARPNWNK